MNTTGAKYIAKNKRRRKKKRNVLAGSSLSLRCTETSADSNCPTGRGGRGEAARRAAMAAARYNHG